VELHEPEPVRLPVRDRGEVDGRGDDVDDHVEVVAGGEAPGQLEERVDVPVRQPREHNHAQLLALHHLLHGDRSIKAWWARWRRDLSSCRCGALVVYICMSRGQRREHATAAHASSP
jgi:hypothetical protein